MLVIFDCDGVLVDSEPIASHVLAEALGEAGHAITAAEAHGAFLGLSMRAVVAAVEREMGHPLPRDFRARFQTRLFAAFRRELRPIAGIHRALARIGERACVASNGEPEAIRLSLGLTGLLARFENRLFSASQIERGKPNPDLFLFAARSLSARAADCVVVEDSLPGVVGARAAGMQVLGYAPGAGPKRDHAAVLGAAGAKVFADMAELPQLIDASKKMAGL